MKLSEIDLPNILSSVYLSCLDLGCYATICPTGFEQSLVQAPSFLIWSRISGLTNHINMRLHWFVGKEAIRGLRQ